MTPCTVTIYPAQPAPRTAPRRLTEMTLMLLCGWSAHFITGLKPGEVAIALKCDVADVQPAFDELERAQFIKQGMHGYVIDTMLRGMVASLLVGAREVH